MRTQAGSSRFTFANFRRFLTEHYPLIGVLVGFAVASLSVGPFYNWDTSLEFDASVGVLNYGLPLMHHYGFPLANGAYLMDQPPLGFYIQALFFKAFGVSIVNGTFLVTLFGLGCVALVYGIGTVAYNEITGFFAALLFAFSPWHLFMSRSFLVDTPCLFFSLLSLFLGLIAVRKGALKLFTASGIVLAAALSTKLYAVYMLVPLLAFFFYHRPRNLKRVVTWLAAFSIPIIIALFLWYQVITGLGFSSIFSHNDFTIKNPTVVAPTPLFATNFLVSYGLGWFFIDAILLSVLVGLYLRRPFHDALLFDATCLATITCVLGVNIYLGAVLALKVPFHNAIKFDYQALPFFSFLAASLVSKSLFLFKRSIFRSKAKKIFLVAVASVGLVLVMSALLYNMDKSHWLSTWNYLIFKADVNINEGYYVLNPTPIGESGLLPVEYLGFAIALSAVVWISRHKLNLLLTTFRKKSAWHPVQSKILRNEKKVKKKIPPHQK